MSFRKTHIIVLILGVVLIDLTGVMPARAQHIGFGLTAGEGITLDTHPGGEQTLNFTLARSVIVAGQSEPILIDRNTNASFIVPVEIQAAAHLDITVEVTGPVNGLEVEGYSGSGDPPSLPFQLGWAYWNLWEGEEPAGGPLGNTVLANSREVLPAEGTPLTFSAATFSMQRRLLAGSPAPPPPTPNHGGFTQPTAVATAYILIYGRMGAIPENAQVGRYSGQIDIQVSYSSYE